MNKWGKNLRNNILIAAFIHSSTMSDDSCIDTERGIFVSQ